MGLIRDLAALIFGSRRNVLRETVEVFRETQKPAQSGRKRYRLLR